MAGGAARPCRRRPSTWRFSLTRFVPGRTGPGLTEDLPALAARMVEQGTPFYQSIPGLWYDRRRDEHSVVSRPMPTCGLRSTKCRGRAAHGDGRGRAQPVRPVALQPWYFERLREFGALCDRRGLVLHHNLYNTHNLLEIAPHWVDYPWRPANNINDTGLPEPPPVEAGNHIHVANQVYDVSHRARRELHRALILHELDELGGTRNLFFSVGAQFAGPLAFQEFFQDTVAEWESRTGRRLRLELATSKDITDAILAVPARARQVAVIDMRYWQYRPDARSGRRPWEEPGVPGSHREGLRRGRRRAPDTMPQQVYRQVREYHDRYRTRPLWLGMGARARSRC